MDLRKRIGLCARSASCGLMKTAYGELTGTVHLWYVQKLICAILWDCNEMITHHNGHQRCYEYHL
jgi:hypothetical protein